MTDAMKVLVALVLIERPDYTEVDAEFAVDETIRELGWGSKQVEVDNAKEFVVRLRQRIEVA